MITTHYGKQVVKIHTLNIDTGWARIETNDGQLHDYKVSDLRSDGGLHEIISRFTNTPRPLLPREEL